jgi:Protein of unknown function (DUF998)
VSQQVAGAGSPPAAPVPAAGTGLLVCGVLAGPLFVTVTTIGIVSREGFDLRRNGISQLSLGDRGWIQIANFIVAGLLSVAFAAGARHALRPGVGAVAAPVLISGYGLGLIATGLFLVDPGVGFPPGTPAGMPDRLSWHGAVHAVAPPVAFGLLVGVCFVFARRFAGQHRFGWAAYCAVTGVAALALVFWPGAGGSVRSAIAVVITSAWMTATSAVLIVDRRLQGGVGGFRTPAK